MIEVLGGLTEEVTGGGFCSACGCAIAEGDHTQVTYGPKRNTYAFRLCPECVDTLRGLLTESAQRERAMYSVMGFTPGDGGMVSAYSPKEALATFISLDEPERYNDVMAQIDDDKLVAVVGSGTAWTYGDYEVKQIVD